LRLFRSLTMSALLVVALLGTASAVSAAPRADKTSTNGFDIGWPQCGAVYPVHPAFGIVGVNRGIVFSPNPCLASEIAWAGGATAQLYANTGNPGPALSTHWPDGQLSPAACNPSLSAALADRDTFGCAYDYGYNAAADSYNDAVQAFTSLGLAPTTAAASDWWFDVETSNSWRSDVGLNVAALQGAASYLTSVGVPDSNLGFYSTQFQWNVITGGNTTSFSTNKSWVAGAASAREAAGKCVGAGFTGGGVALAQYPLRGFDADLRCD
jgi:hypothetical protein